MCEITFVLQTPVRRACAATLRCSRIPYLSCGFATPCAWTAKYLITKNFRSKQYALMWRHWVWRRMTHFVLQCLSFSRSIKCRGAANFTSTTCGDLRESPCGYSPSLTAYYCIYACYFSCLLCAIIKPFHEYICILLQGHNMSPICCPISLMIVDNYSGVFSIRCDTPLYNFDGSRIICGNDQLAWYFWYVERCAST